MPEFIAKVGTSDGTVMERSFTAESEEALRSDLEGKDYLVFKVRRKGGVSGLLPGFGAGRSVKMKEFLLFNQELAALIKAGLPIIASLEILTERRKNQAFRKALMDVRDKVRGGASLSEAFQEQGEMFPAIYSATLASGERSGEIANVLLRYIAYQKTILALKRKVTTALIYPAILFVLMMVLIAILIVWVVPQFTEFYKDFGADLPLLTRALIGVSGFVTQKAIFMVALVALAAVLFRAWMRTPAGRLAIDRFVVRVPVVGGVFHRFAVSRFTRTLGTLIAGGIPAVTALLMSAKAVGNLAFEAKLIDVERKVREGSSLWESLEATGLFNDIAIEMTRVGESTGSLHDMLANISDFYDEEIEARINTIMVFIEPVMLVVMGGFVVLIMLAIYLPLLRSYAQSTY
ncbi:MAG TPA: type II secretion system F family protein [Candidatus Polarisedimenticolia bacterium]|jgi:type IV pilus assembly protein PilC|nr:type II secretion system F family protein [Candidatus Polarisedimenticolia bacterium]